MARLYRPSIPLKARCRVALRQLGEMFIDDVIDANEGRYGALLAGLLIRLAELLRPGESIRLHLDHDPPLGAREQIKARHPAPYAYRPDANDPEFLIYREAEAHGIKTRVRGEHGQHSDLTLIKREKRRLNKNLKKNRSIWRSSSQGKKRARPTTNWPKRKFHKRAKL
jgi:hypothetical protein